MKEKQKATALADVMGAEFVRVYYYFAKYSDMLVMLSAFTITGVILTFLVEFEQREMVILYACIALMVLQLVLLLLISRLKSSVRNWYTRQQFLQDRQDDSKSA